MYPERLEEDRDENALKQSFSKGPIISSNWIVESIASQTLLPAQDFTKFTLRENFKEVSFSRSKFSIREIVKIFDVVSKNPSRRTKNPTYWGTIIDKGIFPGRSVHSINAQWQRFSNYENKEEAIRQALKLKSPYCISFREIPDHSAAIKRVRKEIMDSRNGFQV